MAEIINLREYRKRRARADKKQRAEERRARVGRGPGQKDEDAAERDKADSDLDGKKLGPGTDGDQSA